MFCKQQKSVGSATNQCLSLAWSLTWASETKFKTLTNGWIHKLDDLSYGSVIPSGHMPPWHLSFVWGGGVVCECIQIPHAGAKKSVQMPHHGTTQTANATVFPLNSSDNVLIIFTSTCKLITGGKQFVRQMPKYCGVGWRFQNTNNNNKNSKTLLINKLTLQKYCLQLARLFEPGQCMQNIRNKDLGY